MIHPSYVELMKVVNDEAVDVGEEPVVNSRYSIVIATAKRARQIIAGDEPLTDDGDPERPLSTAVQELYTGKIHIIPEGAEEEPEEETGELSGEEGEGDSAEPSAAALPVDGDGAAAEA